ncbi:response regulator [candidate division KSB1 bacterium]|nr:response regulator [candidate division KSB1 bacterium]
MRVLVIDDDKNIGESLKWLLEESGHKVMISMTGKGALETIQRNEFDLTFLDVMLPDINGLDVLNDLLVKQPELKVVMISGHADLDTAVKATKLGAFDFFEKPLNPEKILLEVKKLEEQKRITAERDELKELLDYEYRIIGKSEEIEALRDQIRRAAPSSGRILIFGENGSGKELVAREIHASSLRYQKPFIQLNCAAIPRELVESELFGHEKGAFTGAHKTRPGMIEQAEGGTLLLDEIGDMAVETQAKLLRVLEEEAFYRVGGTAKRKFDVRIISATNKDLGEAIQNGEFRQDLFYRLNVIPVHVPPLRQRKEDIKVLAEHFMKNYCQKNGKKRKTLSKEAVAQLLCYPWPGNVRELRNVIERLVIMSRGSDVGANDVSDVLNIDEKSRQNSSVQTYSDLSLREQLNHYEKQLLQRIFERYQGNVSRMATALQTDRANLHRKLQKYGLK